MCECFINPFYNNFFHPLKVINVFWTTPQLVSVSLFTPLIYTLKRLPEGSLYSMSVHGLLTALNKEGEEESGSLLIVQVSCFALKQERKGWKWNQVKWHKRFLPNNEWNALLSSKKSFSSGPFQSDTRNRSMLIDVRKKKTWRCLVLLCID